MPPGEVDEQKMTLTCETDPDDLDEGEEPIVYVIPLVYRVCDVCEGKGSHVNPSIDANGLSAEDLREWDDEDRERYFSGGYDITCRGCGGKRVKLCPNPAKGSPEEKWLDEWQRDEADYQAICRAERRMGA